jgi:hypothetical protein
MILTQIEIAPQTAGLAMSVIQRVLLTTILIQRLAMSCEPVILTGIYLERKSPTSCLTLQIRFDSMQNLRKMEAESRILSLTQELHRVRKLGLGVLILGLTATLITCTLALPRRAMQMARSLISQ